jgi:uncharacterized protein
MQADTKIIGLITANLWAKLSATDATLVAVLSEVEPSGASDQVTAGFLMASQRAVDPSMSTYGPKHLMIRPWHPFTKESQQAVTPNQPTEYKVEISHSPMPSADRARESRTTAFPRRRSTEPRGRG